MPSHPILDRNPAIPSPAHSTLSPISSQSVRGSLDPSLKSKKSERQGWRYIQCTDVKDELRVWVSSLPHPPPSRSPPVLLLDLLKLLALLNGRRRSRRRGRIVDQEHRRLFSRLRREEDQNIVGFMEVLDPNMTSLASPVMSVGERTYFFSFLFELMI